LDELVKKAKDDNFANQGDQMTKVIEKLENADTKEEIKEILDSCELTDFAKEAIDKI